MAVLESASQVSVAAVRLLYEKLTQYANSMLGHVRSRCLSTKAELSSMLGQLVVSTLIYHTVLHHVRLQGQYLLL